MRKMRHGEAKYLPRIIQLRGLEPTSGSIQNPLYTFYYYVCLLGWGWRVVRGAVKGVPGLYGECDGYRSFLLRQASLSSVFCRQRLMDLLKRCGDEDQACRPHLPSSYLYCEQLSGAAEVQAQAWSPNPEPRHFQSCSGTLWIMHRAPLCP